MRITRPQSLLARTGLLCLGLTLAGHAAAQGVACLSDEFGDPASLALWSRVEVTEGWDADQLHSLTVNQLPSGVPGEAGRLVMAPYTVAWQGDYRGPLLFKLISGDFAITTRVRISARDGASAPGTQYSLAGVLIRTPRQITPQDWEPGGENHVLLSVGAAATPAARPQFYGASTAFSDTQGAAGPNAPGAGEEAELQLARIGSAVIALRRSLTGPDQAWHVHARYPRPDLPLTLQAGLMCSTNWEKAQVFVPFVHNSVPLNPPLQNGFADPQPFVPYRPDLIASFDFARFARPQVPAALQGADLADPAQATDAQLLAFLGDIMLQPGCPAEFNCDGTVTVQDVFDFLTAYFANDPRADADGSGEVSVQDVFDFLTHYFAGC